MDLAAYANICNYDELAKLNGINLPRIRGYRLMSLEEPVSQSEINEIKKRRAIWVCQELICAEPFWNPNSICSTFDSHTEHLCNYYLAKEENEYEDYEYVEIKWNKIHGWKRKVLKTVIHNECKKIQSYYDMFNKYAGKENVLYIHIHTRMGGNNWTDWWYKNPTRQEVVSAPWLLDMIDDDFDSTYRTFYCKVNLDGWNPVEE